MGLPAWKPRAYYDFDSYLNRIKEIVKRHFGNSSDPLSMEAARFWERWDKTMRYAITVSNGYLLDRKWRRIEYMLNTLLSTFETDSTVRIMPVTFLKIAGGNQPPDIPAWVDDLTRNVPVGRTYTRLAELGEKVREIEKTLLRERKERPELGEGKLLEWAAGIRGSFAFRVYIDRDWERILSMLDQMMETYKDEPRQVLDHSGGIGRYFSAEGMLRSLDEPWNRFARLENDRPTLRPEVLKARNEDRHARKLRMRANETTGEGSYTVKSRRPL